VDGVRSVILENVTNGSHYVYEFDVFAASAVPSHMDITNLNSTNTDVSAALNWTLPTDTTGLTGINVYQNGTLLTTLGSVGSYNVSGLTANTSYTFKVTAKYSDGFETTGLSKTLTTNATLDSIPPGSVTSLTAANIKDTSLTLNWLNSSDSDLASVNIYQNGSLLKNIPLATTTDITNLTALSSYTFGVALVDTSGNVGSITNLNVSTIAAADTTPPNGVTGVKLVPGDSSLYVEWDNNKDSDLDGYNVYIDGVKFNSTLIHNTFVTLDNLNNGQSYTVQVSAVDLAGNESVLSSGTIGTPQAGLMPVLSSKFTLSDYVDGVKKWFSSYWLLIAFSASIPLSFYMISKIKLMFIE
jgi:hypothetical protein